MARWQTATGSVADMEPSALRVKAADAGSVAVGDFSQAGSRQDQGELQQYDYDVETVERVYRSVSRLSLPPSRNRPCILTSAYCNDQETRLEDYST